MTGTRMGTAARLFRGHRRTCSPLPPLPHTLPIPATLIPTTGFGPLRGTIPLPGSPRSPTPGRFPASLTAVPCLGMVRMERLLAPFQQTQPTPGTTPARLLNLGTLQIMLGPAQGRCELPEGLVAARNAYSFRSATLFTRKPARPHLTPYTEPRPPPSTLRTLVPMAPPKWSPR